MKRLVLLLCAFAIGVACLAVAPEVLADSKSEVCKGINAASTGPGTGCTDGAGSINNIITVFLNIFSVVIGIIAVVMIMYGGFKYITAGGDSGNVTSAKQTIIYAIIGLIVVALAQFLVQFVLDKAT